MITRKWYFHYEFLLVSLRVILSQNGMDWSELALAILLKRTHFEKQLTNLTKLQPNADV